MENLTRQANAEVRDSDPGNRESYPGQVVMRANHSDLVNLFWAKDHPTAQWITDWLHRCAARKRAA